MTPEDREGRSGEGVEHAVDDLFRECLTLLERGRELELAARRNERADSALALAETEVRLRTTCCLANALAWLSGQKAVHAGEIPAKDAPALDEPVKADTAHSLKHRDRLDEALVALERQARDLFDRAARLRLQGLQVH